MALHEFAHIELNKRVFAAKEELGQRLGQFGFADAGRSEEHEGADWAPRIFQAGAGASDRFADGDDGFVLPDDALVQLVFHLHQALALFVGDARDGDARPHRRHLGDIFADQARLPGLFVPIVRISANWASSDSRRNRSVSASSGSPASSANSMSSCISSSSSMTRRTEAASGLLYMRRRAAASSIRSMALSGRKRSGMYRADRFAAVSMASSVISTL